MSLMTHGNVLAFIFGAPGTGEMLIVGIIALLLFGKRLPEVARSLGKGIVEFKKGVRGIEDEVSSSTAYKPESSRPAPRETHAEITAPKFEPPTAEPASNESVSTKETSHA
ncbi:MAG: twin-arginine translocase TatA/TatE family subunit [Planctomycetaceae bacterium]